MQATNFSIARRPSTDTPVSDRTELVVTFLLVDRSTKILSDLIHPHSLLSMPSIVSHRIHTKTPVLKLMCPLRPVTPLRQLGMTWSIWADFCLRPVLKFM